MFTKNNTDKILLFSLLTLLIFYGFLSKYIYAGFKYIDEIIVLGLIVYCIILLYKKNKIKINKYDKRIFGCISILSLIGLLGNIISGYQNSIFYIIVDWFAFLKFPLTYFLISKIIQIKYGKLTIQHYNIITRFFKAITVIIAIIVVANIVFRLDLGAGYERFNLPSYSLGGHPTFAAAVCCMLTSYFLIDHKQNLTWIIINLILCAATLRIKAIVWVVLTSGLIIIKPEKKIKKSKMLIFIIAGVVVSLLISFQSIQFYFLSSHASRNNALVSSLKIANHFLPIGGGFATFGTNASITSYSDAYHFTGLADRWGFTQEAPAFVGDGGWATEIGQFGYLGTVFCLLYLLNIYLNTKKKNKNSIYCVISAFMYILIASTSENTLGSEYIVLFGVLFAIISSLVSIENKGVVKS